MSTTNNLNERIDCLRNLGQLLHKRNQDDEPVYQEAFQHNNWFLPKHIVQAVSNIVSQYCDADELSRFSAAYDRLLMEQSTEKTVAIIAAGNLPLVCFHDLLCAYLAGFRIQLKLSSKDSILPKYLLNLWRQADPELRIEVVDTLGHFDLAIATGSNNSNRYFEYYFRKYPSLLRRSRSSVGIVPSDCSDESLKLFMADALSYFGLGCRNISLLFLPRGFEPRRIFPAVEDFRYYTDHRKYMNNYDYQRTILLLNQSDHLANEFVMIQEKRQLFPSIACLNYSFYSELSEIEQFISLHKEDIQCVVGGNGLAVGTAQKPKLSDYADGEDSLAFLLSNK